MNFSNISVTLSWVLPDSLHVSTPPTISHYVLSNNLTNGTKKFNNPTTCTSNPLAFCNYSFDLRDPVFTCVGCYGGENRTILDYNGTILFTFFAVNGAGNGDATTFAYIVPKETPQSAVMHMATPTMTPIYYTNQTQEIPSSLACEVLRLRPRPHNAQLSTTGKKSALVERPLQHEGQPPAGYIRTSGLANVHPVIMPTAASDDSSESFGVGETLKKLLLLRLPSEQKPLLQTAQKAASFEEASSGSQPTGGSLTFINAPPRKEACGEYAKTINRCQLRLARANRPSAWFPIYRAAMLQYQSTICQLFSTFGPVAALKYDKLFRCTKDQTLRWDNLKEGLLQTSPFPRQSAPAPPGGTGAMQQLLPQWLSPMQLARRCATVSMLEGAIGPLSQAAEGLTLADPANTCPRTPPVATCMHELQQAMQDSLGCCQRRLYPCSLDTRRFPRRTARAVRAARYGDQPRFQAAGDGVPSMAYIRGGRAAQVGYNYGNSISSSSSSSSSASALVIRRGIAEIITHCHLGGCAKSQICQLIGGIERICPLWIGPYCTPVMLVSTDETAVRQTTQVPQLQQPLVQVELCASSEAVYCHLTSEGATGQTATTDIYKCSIMRAPAVEGFLEAVHSIPVPSTLCGFHELAA
eukprot:Em0010g500a